MKRFLSLALLLVLVAFTAISCVSSGEASEGESAAKAEIKLMPVDAELVVGADSEGLTIEDGGVVGWWSSLDDKVMWETEIPADGTYSVMVVYSVAADFAGASVDFRIGDKVIPWTAVSTTEWANFTASTIGSVELNAGATHAELQATNIIDRFVANISYVMLIQQ